MQRKFLKSIVSQNNLLLFVLLFFSTLATCTHQEVNDEPDEGARISILDEDETFITDNTELILPDGRMLVTKRAEPLNSFLILKKGEKVLWKKKYEEAYDSLWHYAYFVPILKEKYYADVNQDGYLEVAVGIWDGGNSPCRTAHIFTVKNRSLKYVTSRRTGSERVEAAYLENCKDPRFN